MHIARTAPRRTSVIALSLALALAMGLTMPACSSDDEGSATQGFATVEQVAEELTNDPVEVEQESIEDLPEEEAEAVEDAAEQAVEEVTEDAIDATTDAATIDPADIPYTRITDMSLSMQTEYAHGQDLYDDRMILGNDEMGAIVITASPANLTFDDFYISWESDDLELYYVDPTSDGDTTTLVLYVEGTSPVTDYICIWSSYDLVAQGGAAEPLTVPVVKLDSTDGRVVYVTMSGSKYHYSQECAGDGAIATCYYDVKNTSLDNPCGKCAS